MHRVLVASITFDKEEYALASVLDAIAAQTVSGFDVLFVDTSEQDGYGQTLSEELERRFSQRHTVLRAIGQDRASRILSGRQAVRDFALAKGYEQLLMVDSDVVLPPHALATFVAAGLPLASGVYLNTFARDGKPDIRPCLFLDKDGASATIASMRDVLTHEQLPIGAAGLGCTFVAREVLEKLSFRRNSSGAGEDINFYRDAAKLGCAAVALCRVRCAHLHFPKGDRRNKLFDANMYRLG